MDFFIGTQVKSSFSELSYAFALTENLIHDVALPLALAPAFPSTSAEGKKGAGHDLKLSYPGMNLFLQFKVSHCMSNASAKEFTSGKFPIKLGGKKTPVYRMYLHALKRSRQTTLLLELEKRNCFVYYVAPLFHLPTDLSKNFFAKMVARESRFLRPSIIRKMPDQKEHFVSFRKIGKPWRFSDDSVELNSDESYENVVSLIKRELLKANKAEHSIRTDLDTMFDVLLKVFKTGADASIMRNEVERLRASDMPILEKARFVARNFFDVEFVTFATADGLVSKK